MDALLTTPTFSLHRPTTGARSGPLLLSLLGHGLLLALPLIALQASPIKLPPLSVTLSATLLAPSNNHQQTAEPAAITPSPIKTHAPQHVPALTTPAPGRPTVLASPATTPVTTATTATVEAPAEVAKATSPSATANTTATSNAVPKATPVQDNNALAQYGQSLSEWLARQQRYPRLAEMRGWEGEVRLHLRIARKGALVDVQISHSSGYDVLDRSALQLVQGAALPPPPANLALGNEETLDITVPVHYRLRRS
jgi:protein TonB